MDFYKELNLKHVINASGKMTILGVSKLPEESIKAQQFGDSHFFEMADLVKKSGEYIAKLLGAEDAVIVNSASAGIAQTIAALIGQGNKYHLYHPYSDRFTKRNFILPKGQNVDYGAPEEEMIAVGGGHIIEAGYANMCSSEHIEWAIDDSTAAIFYVKSHHAVQKSMLSIEDALKVAHQHGLPLILDAAAEEDLKKYVEMGVDIVIFSGAKAIEGPAAGLVYGKRKYIEWIRMQSLGLGRSMKIGKENIFGLLGAIEKYLKVGPEKGKDMHKRLIPFMSELNQVPHIKVREQQDQAGREIYRADVVVDKLCPKNAKEIIKELKENDPAIYTREYRANEGIIEFDIRAVDSDEMSVIVDRLKEILR
ncbi:DgaE family pyridoxal phosphate-dependent ammonia lyase [Lactobacillus sp. ESL0684]|uniref:DgaE family pyridoxal phosphate-dependent ammonia lyase n=1 Tax=Lactobacillus sp. ESL0684 TaxID=2983213 RepID=UPI0023F99B1F|nr:DgaE family pyridoxal phosphate-dependent ammonia lyase [Lactobacillus sp. ESL0684]WEV43599.1 DgaE family pyridoxal phosphate-dependent ammonia lyase [Lactobacillus sp. ESL0684]